MSENVQIIKIIIVGDSGIGKSSLINMYCDGNFTDSYISTIGVDFKLKNIDITNKKYRLKVWDTAGQERFRTITSIYYRGANIVMLMFDLTNKNTFDGLNKWIQEIKHQMENDNYEIVLIGNKCEDIKTREIEINKIHSFAEHHGMDYFEVSAKKNINVDTTFFNIAKKIADTKNEKTPISEVSTSDENKNIDLFKNKIQNKCCY